MSGNAQKVAFARSQNEFAEKKIASAIRLLGKSLPASVVEVTGWIVKVKFEVDATPWTLPQVTVPVLSSNYDYLPIQVGDVGVVWSADVRLGNVSGLGGGPPVLTSIAGNLSMLAFEPIGKKAWEVPGGDADFRVVQGPGGVLIQSIDGTVAVKLDKDSGDVTVTASGKINLNGELWINGQKYFDHVHSGVDAGSDDTGGVVP